MFDFDELITGSGLMETEPRRDWLKIAGYVVLGLAAGYALIHVLIIG